MIDIQALLSQLLHEVREAGGSTAQLLDLLDETSEAHRVINEMDSHLSIWEDDIEELIKHL